VAAGHPATVEAAAVVLRSGGNAFDGVVAAGFAAAVAEPLLTGLGGGGFMLAREADGTTQVDDFFVDTPGRGLGATPEPHFVPVTIQFPGSTQEFNVGRGSAAVPGALAGYLQIHERMGRLPLGDVVAPAVRLAREGLVLDRFQASVIELLWPILALSEEGSRWYGTEGRPRVVGDRISNPDLGEFMEAVASHTSAGFYSGPLADRVAADMAAGDGLITAADLDAYEVIARPPLAIEYRDRTVLTNPTPAFGGALVALGLQLMGELPSDASIAERARQLVRLEEIRDAGQVLDRLRSSGGTTHVSVADVDGNVAATTTSNGENSGYVVPGTGVMLNNMLGEDDLHPNGFHASPPGERVSSMMSPTLVLRDDRVEAVLGSGGSKRIRSALIQSIVALVDDGAAVDEAIERPRLHWDGEVVQIEPGFDPEALIALAEEWTVNEWSEKNMYFGGPHVVRPGIDAAGDSRRGGAAVFIGPPPRP
jgi:gamma-glutamyltranspeptidase/glutathione hydrolase